MREIGKRHFLTVGVLWSFFCSGIALGADGASPQPATTEGAGTTKPAAGAQAATQEPSTTEEAKLLSAVRDALERNAQEIKSLKEQYAKDMAEQKKKVEAQQQQIATLQQSAQALQDRLKAQIPVPSAPGGQNAQGQDRQKQLTDLQQKEIGVLEQQSKLIAEELGQQAPAIENLQGQTATLESRAQQAARRDMALANQDDAFIEQMDAELRNGPALPATLKGLFAPVQTTSSPLTIVNTFAARYDLFTHNNGAGVFEFQEFTPFLLAQLNKRILLSAQLTFAPAGVVLTQAQADIFINDWLTMDIGYFLAPIGFFNERLYPEWINKLPDQPLVMRQVIPDGLTLTGVQFRGSKYLFGSPVKMEYSVYATDSLGVPSNTGQPGWANLTRLVGSTANINQGMAYGGRFGFWLPAHGINFGVSEFANAPYSHADGAVTSIWQPYFNYHRGNWDFRFEDGQNYERTTSFLGHSISRSGFYTQFAYRDYKSTHPHLQKLEYVFRYSQARFAGINQQGAAANLAQFATPMDAPVDRNQYTIGINYYMFPVTVFKIAYEINEELHTNLKDNVLFVQFATNF
jgi:hypothetical protein